MPYRRGGWGEHLLFEALCLRPRNCRASHVLFALLLLLYSSPVLIFPAADKRMSCSWPYRSVR